ncbi:hypothetical protein [Helicobacter bizzozeronii]|uniref:hypothetical protein n=1 Tax=Helicobacter bizzozeronii TaxID=56877 RepID=UPI001315995F|nr:hypothetical protein [Helicobacter bizzozeronii]
MEDRQKSLTDKIETLRILIERTTDGATKRILKAEKADYLRELMELISADQTTPPPQLPSPSLLYTSPTPRHRTPSRIPSSLSTNKTQNIQCHMRGKNLYN